MAKKSSTKPASKPKTEDSNIPKRVVNEHGAEREAGVAGSKNSKHPARYDLISTIGLRRLAETYGEGSIKYGPHSYLRGFPASDLINHVLAHLNAYRAGTGAEDDLAHAAWGLFSMMHFEETRPDLMDLQKGVPEGQHP